MSDKDVLVSILRQPIRTPGEKEGWAVLPWKDAEYIADHLIKLGVKVPVFCKDCRYRVYDCVAEEHWCDNPQGLSEQCRDTDYCSYGERRNNA